VIFLNVNTLRWFSQISCHVYREALIAIAWCACLSLLRSQLP